jgi:hypothetical protein
MSSGSKGPRKGSNPDNSFDAIFPGTTQKITTSASSQQSAAFAAATTIVRLIATKACYIKFAANPTAAATDVFLPENVVEYFGVTGAEKLAVIWSTEEGVLHICEGAST